MIIGNKSKNLGELLEAPMEAETVIKDLKSWKSSRKNLPPSRPQDQRKNEVLNVQTKSTPQPQNKAESKTTR